MEHTHQVDAAEEEPSPITPEEAKLVEETLDSDRQIWFTKDMMARTFNVPLESISDGELAEFVKFATWAVRHLYHAAILSPYSKCGTREDRVECAVRIVRGQPALHELTHVLVQLAKDPKQPVPEFYRQDDHLHDEELIRDEIHAFHFWNNGGDIPIFLALSEQGAADEWASSLVRLVTNMGTSEMTTRAQEIAGRMKSMPDADRSDFEKCYALGVEALLIYFEALTYSIERSSNKPDQDDYVRQIHGAGRKIGHQFAHQNIKKAVLTRPNPILKSIAKDMYDSYRGGNRRASFDEGQKIWRKAIKDNKIT